MLRDENELRNLICINGEKYDKQQWNRMLITFAVLSLALLYFFLKGKDFDSATDFLYIIVCSICGAGLIMFLSYLVLSFIINGAIDKIKNMTALETELQLNKKIQLEVNFRISEYKEQIEKYQDRIHTLTMENMQLEEQIDLLKYEDQYDD